MENFNTIISQYLDFCKNNKNLNDKTLKSYLIDLEQFNDYISDNYIGEESIYGKDGNMLYGVKYIEIN